MQLRRSAARMTVAAGVAWLLTASPAGAADGSTWLDTVGGHLSVGYAKLFIADAPGGSISLGGGVDLPVVPHLRAGVELGYHLLGSRTLERGSLLATVDYSVFEAIAFAHWLPENLGPIGRISVGPALIAAKGELSSSGGGAGFSDVAVSEIAPGAALDVTLMAHSSSPVRVGLELGARTAFLANDTWSLATARVTAHF
jgi:hypothetical protein